MRRLARVPHDAPFYRIREIKSGGYRLEDLLIGDLDDVVPGSTASHLQRENDRNLYGSLDDVIKKFAPGEPGVFSWM